MIDLNEAVSLLRAKREELLDQLGAVDKALAALSGFSPAATPPPEPSQATESAVSTVLPTRVKPPRTLTDEHKHALKEGRRRAHHAKAAAAGLAREQTEPSPGLAPGAGGRQPRLVKPRH